MLEDELEDFERSESMNAVIDSPKPSASQRERFGGVLARGPGKSCRPWLALVLMFILLSGLAGCGTAQSQPDLSFPPLSPSGMAQQD